MAARRCSRSRASVRWRSGSWMQWRRGSVGDRERYLRQQMELGGGELVLSRKATELVTVASAPVGQGAEESAAPPRGREEGASAPVKVTVRDVPSLQNTGEVSAVRRPRADNIAAPVEPPAAEAPKIAPGAWRKHAPPVPTEIGLSYDPPAALAELATLDAVAASIATCRKCGLCEKRTHTVPGEGDPKARFVVVGEGPGATEDETG